MSALVVAATTLFAPAAATGAAAVATGGLLSGVLGTAVKAAFVGGIVSKATGGSFGKGFLMGGLGGAVLGGLGSFGGAAGGASGAAGSAAGAAGGGLFSGGFLGNVLAGAAQSWQAGAEMKEREAQGIREEERREDRYTGVGNALSPFTKETPTGLDGGFATQAAAGGPAAVDERAVDRGVLSAGDKYQRQLDLADGSKKRQRARYNPESRRIEYEDARATA